jgi:predicted ATP-grasp superfamily ATP-dependent carboligase
MRVFVYEFTCVQPGELGRGNSLGTEGRAMLTAVLQDFSRIPGVETLTLLHGSGPEVPGTRSHRLSDSSGERSAFEALATNADTTLVIAPEFAGILAERCHWVEGTGGRLLGPTPAAVELTADKLVLAERLQSRDVPTPQTRPLADVQKDPAWLRFPVVCKPRDGAGSQATFLARDLPQLEAGISQALCSVPGVSLLVQPFVPGLAVSIAFLLGPRQTIPLLSCGQELSQDGRFHYLGGSLPLPSTLAVRSRRLARRAVEAVEGLQGYVGVDLVLGEPADGSEDQVIEINPRLTTSYVGLRALAATNLAEAMLCLAEGEAVPPVVWKDGAVRFRADGTVSFNQALDAHAAHRL